MASGLSLCHQELSVVNHNYRLIRKSLYEERSRRAGYSLIGVCGPKGYGFRAVLFINRIRFFHSTSLKLRTFALIVSVHPYCARKFACHVIHERAR